MVVYFHPPDSVWFLLRPCGGIKWRCEGDHHLCIFSMIKDSINGHSPRMKYCFDFHSWLRGGGEGQFQRFPLGLSHSDSPTPQAKDLRWGLHSLLIPIIHLRIKEMATGCMRLTLSHFKFRAWLGHLITQPLLVPRYVIYCCVTNNSKT